jgi:hypothetical protein
MEGRFLGGVLSSTTTEHVEGVSQVWERKPLPDLTTTPPEARFLA